MKCNAKVMFYVAAAMVAAAGSAYFFLEGARTTIVASLPLLAVLLCPVSMLVMMKMMSTDGKSCSSTDRDQGAGEQANARGQSNADVTKGSTTVAPRVNVA